MVNWFTIRFARAELINNDDFPFSKMHATHTKQRMHMRSSLKENHFCGTNNQQQRHFYWLRPQNDPGQWSRKNPHKTKLNKKKKTEPSSYA